MRMMTNMLLKVWDWIQKVLIIGPYTFDDEYKVNKDVSIRTAEEIWATIDRRKHHTHS